MTWKFGEAIWVDIIRFSCIRCWLHYFTRPKIHLFCVFFAFLWETILITFSSCDTLTLLSRDVRLQSRRFVSHVPSCALTPKPRNTKSQVWSVWKCEENMSWFYVPNSFLKTSFVCEEATSHSKEWSTALFSFDVWKCDQIRFLVFDVLLLRF